MLVTPSGIIDIANGLVITSISLHSAWPGTDGLSNELSGGGYARQSISFPAAVTSPTRTYTAATTWSVPANATVAFYGMWNGSTFKAVAANGGSEKEVRRILTTGAIWCPGHGLAVGNRVAILGDWPSPFTEGSLYYVKSVTPDTLSLSATSGGAALAPATANANTNMVLSKIDLQVFGGSGTFTLTGMDLRWKWTDAGPVVNPEPTGFRWTSTRPIPPQEITLSANQTYDFLQHLTGGEPTSVKIVSGEAALNALGITYNEQLGALVAGPTLTAGSVDIVMRASDERIVDYTGQEFYYRVWTGRETMPRDDAVAHANTGYRASTFWNQETTADGVTGLDWNSHDAIGFSWGKKGGDYDPNPLGSITTTATSYAEGTTFTIDLTSAVKELANGREHYGFLLRPGASNAGRHEFYAREHATVSKRPKLVVNGTTLYPESDATLDIQSAVTDPGEVLSLAGKDIPTTAELRTAIFWFGFDNYFSANSITSGTQITSAVLTLTIYRTRTAGAGTYTMYHVFAPEDVAIPPVSPVGIAWPGEATGDPAHPTVGLRDENLKYHSSVYWYEDFQNGLPNASNWNDWRVYGTETPDWGLTGSLSPGTFDTRTLGNLITDGDTQFPELGTMSPMYPGQRSVRIYWPGAMSPANRCPYESNLSTGLTNYFTVKSVGADGLFTLNGTFAGSGTKSTWKYGNNPFGDREFYPRGWAPCYVIAGNKMALPNGFSAHPTKRLTVSGQPIDVPIGRCYFAMCVQSADQNQFYLSDRPFGDPIVPGVAVNSDGTYVDKDFIQVTTARRLGVTPMAADIKPEAKNADGTFKYKASPPILVNGEKNRALDQFWFRYYVYIPDTYQIYKQSSKQFGGADGQYSNIRGMGYGNGGSEADGIGGSTIRFHSEFRSMIPLGELGVQFTLYTYCYGPGVSSGYYDIFQNLLPLDSNTGGVVAPNKYMRWFLEYNRWHCIEYFMKTNSLVPNNEPIFIGDSVTPNYNCVINGQVQPCPTGYACYNPIHAVKDTSIDPATGKQRNPFGGPYPNTFRSPIGLPATWANGRSTFSYSYVQAGKTYEYEMFVPRGVTFWSPTTTNASMRSAATDPSFRRACIERLPTKMYVDPSTGKSDGQCIVYHNNREVLNWDGLGLRHVDMCKDGVTPLKLNGPIMTMQEGGVDRDAFEYVMYFTRMCMASERIGPGGL